MSQFIVRAGSWVSVLMVSLATLVLGKRVLAAWAGATPGALHGAPEINASVALYASLYLGVLLLGALVFRQVAVARNVPAARVRCTAAIVLGAAALAAGWLTVWTR